ncbi:DNA cytosine methyltransferase, partial [Candidatus Kaiserbacteria bacterium]|nr:DNA cytosine methyltransferase [Candidatus Kaiserbacteria bacterium]
FYTIISTLDELGYDCQWQVLNSKNHGVPQNRERVFIIGHLRGTPRPEVFPFGQGFGELPSEQLQELRGSGPRPIWKVGDSESTRRAILSGYTMRRFTPVECERLQGFPDGWTEGVSDRQRYKCLGNAVTVNVIKDICVPLLQY